jgi:SAM-dependent methyltransferase
MTDATGPVPPNRWELSVTGTDSSYAQRFEQLIEQGQDIDGEARLVDVLAPRAAAILDAGSGMGRVAGALAVRGHDVTAIEKDAALVTRSRVRYPDVPVVACDLLELTPALLEAAGRPASYDVVVVVGNVMVYLADDTEVRALRTLGALLAPDGRMLVGFHPRKGPAHSRDYPVERFAEHVAEAGLVLEALHGSYDLRPPSDEYVVAVLSVV